MSYSELLPLLHYIYHGEVQVHHSQIGDFLRTARLLQVRGLAVDKGNDSPVPALQDAFKGEPPPFPFPHPFMNSLIKPESSPAPGTPSSQDNDEINSCSPALKRPRLINSLGSAESSPLSPPPRSDSSPPSSATITGHPLPGLPGGLPPLPPHPVLSLPLSLPSSLNAFHNSVSSSLGLPRPASVSQSVTSANSPSTTTPSGHLSFASLPPNLPPTSTAQSEDTNDTSNSDKSDDKNKNDQDGDEETESSLDKMTGLANMAAFKGKFLMH